MMYQLSWQERLPKTPLQQSPKWNRFLLLMKTSLLSEVIERSEIDTLNFQKNAHICCLERGLIFLSSGFLEILLPQWMIGLLNLNHSNANSSKMGHVLLQIVLI